MSLSNKKLPDEIEENKVLNYGGEKLKTELLDKTTETNIKILDKEDETKVFESEDCDSTSQEREAL